MFQPGIAPIIAPTPQTRRQPKGLHRVADRSPWVLGVRDVNKFIRFSMPKMEQNMDLYKSKK